MRRTRTRTLLGAGIAAAALVALTGCNAGGPGGSDLSFDVADDPDITGSPTFDEMVERGGPIIGVKEDQPGLGYLDATTNERSAALLPLFPGETTSITATTPPSRCRIATRSAFRAYRSGSARGESGCATSEVRSIRAKHSGGRSPALRRSQRPPIQHWWKWWNNPASVLSQAWIGIDAAPRRAPAVGSGGLL